MLHLIDRLVVLVLGELGKSHILVHLGVQEVLVDSDKFVIKNFVEVANNV